MSAEAGHPRPSSLLPLLKPRSIAIVGASDDPTRIGGRPLRYCKEHFDGPVYAVNPKRALVQGLKAYARIAELPEGIDCAILVVPAAATLQAVEDCMAKKIPGLVVLSSGFAEVGEEGAAMQRRIAAAARAGGARIVGPNCLGLFNARRGNYVTFSSSIEHGKPQPGAIAIASQSGAYGSHLFVLARMRGLGLSTWITTGNECDVDVADAIAFLAEDPETHVIAAYAEGFRERERLFAAFAAARRARKPVVMMKVGKSAVGADAARTHTAALAGDDAVCDAVLREFGVHRAATADEMFDVAYAAARRAFPASRRLGIMTISGGAGVIMADSAAELGLELPAMPPGAQARLKSIVPFCAPRNPVDITGQAFNDVSMVEKALDAMLEEGGYDAIVAFFTSWASSPTMSPGLLAAAKRAADRHRDRLVVLCILAPQDVVRDYERAGFLCFEDPTRAVAAVAALARFRENFDRPPRASPPALPAGALPPPTGPASEHEAKKILASAGIPVVDEILARNKDEAAAAARRFAGRVALKIASPDIAHKTEAGGVMLDVEIEDAGRAFDELLARVKRRAPKARIDGALVSPLVRDGVETILGVRRDRVFGPVVVFGLGGVYVEVLNDSVLRLAPFGVEDAGQMIRAIRGFPLLAGARGRPPLDIGALADALARLSAYAAAHADSIELIDINPFVVRPHGAVALDALIIPAGKGE